MSVVMLEELFAAQRGRLWGLAYRFARLLERAADVAAQERRDVGLSAPQSASPRPSGYMTDT